MNKERHRKLDIGEENELTRQEQAEGWMFCNDCDGLLTNTKTYRCKGVCQD